MKKLAVKDPTLKLVLGPTLTVVAISVLFFYLINFSYPIITGKLTEISEGKKTENTLSERVELLKIFREGILDDKSEEIYTVLPDENSSAVLISQFKEDLDRESLRLSSVEVVGEKEGTEIFKMKVVYKFSTDDFNKPLSVALALKETAPLTTVDKIKAAKDVNNSINAEVTTSIYWSALPDKLPSLTEPVVKISEEDQQVLDRVLRYRYPRENKLNPEINNLRNNPFN